MSLKQWGGAILGCAALLLTACDVVKLDTNGKPVLPESPGAKASFDNMTPQQIAQQTWQTRVMDAAQQHALDAAGFTSHLAASGASEQSYFLHITGPVTQVDTRDDREQKVTITVNGRPLIIQAGPVMRGNAIRDAAGFKFEDFTNQVQFAQLSKAYNREAAGHMPKLDDTWTGKNAAALVAVTLVNGQAQDAVALDLKQETP